MATLSLKGSNYIESEGCCDAGEKETKRRYNEIVLLCARMRRTMILERDMLYHESFLKYFVDYIICEFT